MKIVLSALAAIVVIIVLLVALLFHGGGEISRPGKPEPAQGAPAAGFEPLIALLQADMSKVDVPLDAPRQTPANAFNIKSKLRGVLDRHQEYKVLDRVCDLIIYADQEHDVRAQSYKASQNQVSDTSQNGDAIHSQTAAAWDAYRKQTSAEVQRLLHSLEGKKI